MHLFRAASLSGLDSIISSLGLSTTDTLKAVGFPRNCLAPKNSDNYLPLLGFETLFSLLEAESKQYNLAARMGSQQELSQLLGVLGFVMQQASTVGEAFKELEHYFTFQLQQASLNVDVFGEQMNIAFNIHDSDYLPSTRHTTEFAVAAAISIMQAFCGADWRPQHIQFKHENPSTKRNIKLYLKAPVLYQQVQNAIICKASDFEIPLSSANKQVKQILNSHLAFLESTYSGDFISQVNQLIQQALSTGGCSSEKIARFLGIHRRTLHRKLAELDTSYTELLENVRKNTAIRMLGQSNIAITMIADLLCYSNLSSFSRAFKRWTRLSPQAFRDSN